MADDSLNVTRGRVDEPRQGQAENQFTREVEDNSRIGRSGLLRGKRDHLWGYDRDQGARDAKLVAGTDKADRMSVVEAGRKMKVLHEAFGITQQMEGFYYDFDHAMFICYALNGGSQLIPAGRVHFYVGAPEDDGVHKHSFDYATVVEVLGVDMRRFFRTFANDVVAACRIAIERCDFNDYEAVEIRRQLILLAQARGIARYPHLVADCADAATELSSNEYHAVTMSKAAVIAGTPNSVDKRNTAVPIRSSDNHDSTVGESVPVSVDVNTPGYYK